MKKLLAMLLSLIMLLVLLPAAVADDTPAEYTLVIKGGQTNENVATIDGVNCLKVDVMLTGTIEEAVFGFKFGIGYDPEQLTLKDFEAGDTLQNMTVNDKVPGSVVCACISLEGTVVNAERKMITLYFELDEDLETGDEIEFELAEGGYVETGDVTNVTTYDLAADLSPYIVSEFRGSLEWVEGFENNGVEFKGTTPYVIWNYDKHEPAFRILDENGAVIDPANYDYEFKENQAAGTGYVFVTLKGEYTGSEIRGWFKIYLPATTKTTVENVADGILVTWEPVEDAAGYVIYRRAWSTTTGGWTAFARWNNTTETSYVDGLDDAHKVYAGTRYQYGVKAYFERRLDPIAEEEIGGNVGDNFNLGMVGPLKTTVRITTRELSSVTPGAGQLTIKWVPTKNFTGIQVQYATDANFKQNSKNYKIVFELDDDGNVVTPVVSQDIIKELTSGTTYYVRIRSYCLFEGMNYYGEWSNVLSGTVN